MKNSWNIFFLACFLIGSMPAMAQTNNGATPAKKSSTAATEKNKKVAAETKKPSGTPAGSELKTDDQGRQYKMVDGRKVLIDSQGVQSLAIPNQPAVNPKQLENKNK